MISPTKVALKVYERLNNASLSVWLILLSNTHWTCRLSKPQCRLDIISELVPIIVAHRQFSALYDQQFLTAPQHPMICVRVFRWLACYFQFLDYLGLFKYCPYAKNRVCCSKLSDPVEFNSNWVVFPHAIAFSIYSDSLISNPFL